MPLEKNARNFRPAAGPADSADHQKKKRPDTDVVPRALQLDFKGFKNAYKAEQSGLTGLHAVNAWRESRDSHAIGAYIICAVNALVTPTAAAAAAAATTTTELASPAAFLTRPRLIDGQVPPADALATEL